MEEQDLAITVKNEGIAQIQFESDPTIPAPPVLALNIFGDIKDEGGHPVSTGRVVLQVRSNIAQEMMTIISRMIYPALVNGGIGILIVRGTYDITNPAIAQVEASALISAQLLVA